MRKVIVSKLEAAITRRVTEARQKAQLTHKEVGEALSLSETGYGHYERFRQPFTIEQLFQLSRILGRSVEWFLGLDNDLTPEEDHLLALYRNASDDRQGIISQIVVDDGEARIIYSPPFGARPTGIR